MIVSFEKCELKIDEIRKDEISNENFAKHERKVIELITAWKEKKPHLMFNTSGSTGKPKVIEIEREKILYSCEATMQKVDPHNQFKSSLLCINPEMIGGAMVVFRALMRNLDLRIMKPQPDPLTEVEREDQHYDVVSLVPLQLKQATETQLSRFSTIFVGGASFLNSDTHTSAKIYSTFGMTETVSHFALKEAHSSYFECTGDTIVEKSNTGQLNVRGTLTSNKWLATNDLIELISPTKFKWIGRSDLVINSGAVKINPEEAERKLFSVIAESFFISHLPDDRFQNKVILVIEGESGKTDIDFSTLDKYEKPREVYFLKRFIRTPSEKIDRIRTRDLLIEQLRKE